MGMGSSDWVARVQSQFYLHSSGESCLVATDESISFYRGKNLFNVIRFEIIFFGLVLKKQNLPKNENPGGKCVVHFFKVNKPDPESEPREQKQPKKAKKDQSYIQVPVDKVKEIPDKTIEFGLDHAKVFLQDPKKERLQAVGIDEHHGNFVDSVVANPFLAAVMYAFSFHLPLVLRPDFFWELVMEVVSEHIHEEESLRPKIVAFEGKQRVVVDREDFVLDGDNPWHEVFPQFSEQVKSNINPGAYDALRGTGFSTTTPIDNICRDVALMNSTCKFFDFVVRTKCGFPSMRLDGTHGDWLKLVQDVERLGEYLTPEFGGKWLPAVVGTLARLADTHVKADPCFLGSMVKYRSTKGSGARTYVTGWITNFFPNSTAFNFDSVCTWEQRKVALDAISKDRVGVPVENFPRRMSSAPVTWEYFNRFIPLAFRAGCVGFTKSDVGITPVMGWAVVEV